MYLSNCVREQVGSKSKITDCSDGDDDAKIMAPLGSRAHVNRREHPTARGLKYGESDSRACSVSLLCREPIACSGQALLPETITLSRKCKARKPVAERLLRSSKQLKSKTYFTAHGEIALLYLLNDPSRIENIPPQRAPTTKQMKHEQASHTCLMNIPDGLQRGNFALLQASQTYLPETSSCSPEVWIPL